MERTLQVYLLKNYLDWNSATSLRDCFGLSAQTLYYACENSFCNSKSVKRIGKIYSTEQLTTQAWGVGGDGGVKQKPPPQTTYNMKIQLILKSDQKEDINRWPTSREKRRTQRKG